MIEEFEIKFGETIENPYVLPPATPDTLGGVMIGNGLESQEDGQINVLSQINLFTAKIEVGEISTEVNYNGRVVCCNAWKDGNLIQCQVNKTTNSIIFTLLEPTDVEIECEVWCTTNVD